MDYFEYSLILASSLIILSVLASKASSRFGIPALLVFLLIGIAAGPHGLAYLPSVNLGFAQRLGIFALIFILFSGGMDTQIKSARAVLGPALILSTVGVVISSVLVGFFAHFIFGFTVVEGCLLGAAVSSTDVAAVFTVLRSKNVSLNKNVGPLLELESALNDPMTVFLGVGLLGVITQTNQTLIGLIPVFFKQMIVGAVFGWGLGRAATWVINRIGLEFEGLYPVLSIGWILMTFAATQFAGGSGFLAAYVTGIVLGNENLLHKKSLIHFHEGIAWLMQIAMFLTMGLIVNPDELLKVAPNGIALSLLLVLFARPLSVFLCFKSSRFNWQEKLMISWAGLRGAVPIILATYPLVAHIPQASHIFNLVFFVTFTSVLLQGTTIPWVAGWLKLAEPLKTKFRFPLEFNPTQNLRNELTELIVPPRSPVIGKTLLELSLPIEALIVLIQRESSVLVPRGGTRLAEADTLLVLAEGPTFALLEKRVSPAQSS